MNFLEELLAEWYAYQGYFVKSNVKFGRRPAGGWVGEMDVIAFDPKNRVLVHLETSSDSESWNERRSRFRKKFRAAKAYYKSAFDFKFRKTSQVAVVGIGQPKKPVHLGDHIELLSVPNLMREIMQELSHADRTNAVVSESYPLLRAIQYATWYRT